MTNLAVSVAGLQTLGAPLSLDVAREADELGYGSVWVAEANAAEAMALLGAVSQVAPHSGLGTGVLALQLRTPPLHAMAAATLQQLAGDRDVFLGVGISSPAVAGQWHGAGYTDRPIAQVREFVALLRECLSGETVTFDGDFYSVSRFRLGVRLGEQKPKIVLAALNEQMLRLGGEIADGVLLNYLPASIVPWCVEQVRKGGDAAIYAYVHCGVTDRDRYADLARKDLVNYAVVDAYANQFAARRLRRRRRRVPRPLEGEGPRRCRGRDRRRLGRRHPDHGRRRPRAGRGAGVRRQRRRHPDRVRAAVGRGPAGDRERDASRASR